jgi:hypothetical protein
MPDAGCRPPFYRIPIFSPCTFSLNSYSVAYFFKSATEEHSDELGEVVPALNNKYGIV